MTQALSSHYVSPLEDLTPPRISAALGADTLPEGRGNPLYRPVRYVEPVEPNRPHRVRRLCCIRYLIEGWATASTARWSADAPPDLSHRPNQPPGHRQAGPHAPGFFGL